MRNVAIKKYAKEEAIKKMYATLKTNFVAKKGTELAATDGKTSKTTSTTKTTKKTDDKNTVKVKKD